TAHPATVKVTCRELQRKFNNNEGGYPNRMGSLRRVCLYDRPASPKSRQPSGTKSQLWQYFDGSIPVMWLHCFLLDSGDLGGSRKMDPKSLLVGNVYYFCS